MSTSHLYFSSGQYRLLAHLDLADVNKWTPNAVLFVAPFGWEETCSYRPLRWLAQLLAAKGISVLRFDLPGTGDSSGDACDPHLFEAWIQSISDAATLLRELSGASNISLLGVRLGAMLGLTAVVRGVAAVHDLILWAPCTTGRAYLREIKAMRSLESSDHCASDTQSVESIPGFEAGGFLMSPQTVAELEALDFSKLPSLHHRSILLLSRDQIPHDCKLVAALKVFGVSLVLRTGAGLAAMTGLPDDVEPPVETGNLILDFFARTANGGNK